MDPLLIALTAIVLNRRKQNAEIPPRPQVNGETVAILYQLPDDGFTTTRLATSSGGDDPVEVGIFSNPDAAKQLANSKGWSIAHGGAVLQLKTRPGG